MMAEKGLWATEGAFSIALAVMQAIDWSMSKKIIRVCREGGRGMRGEREEGGGGVLMAEKRLWATEGFLDCHGSHAGY
jgi:hypothetical protein